ncbi:hypothetical protein NIE88_03155 [Sporolactobacillus shoreicorticis]|uniref:ABC-three component system protein n=1 Tax=Sporolactobacillus shoreicorticis TaxID=1923877 RepID=A0ABW5RZR7_9BACL|nr:ABC-three component system protein [Sporolactobacillus shoreicorticis]MCO7124772.1 hypothetical protein [Sporolactobacillus shoreicorticis]
MDEFSRAFYEAKFENAFYRKKENEFQDFFSLIMGLNYRGDFMQCKPWGKIGDRKNDGYIKNSKTLFQVYAPERIIENNWIKKINDDFNGCLPYWKEYFNTWIFVHNQEQLSPNIINTLLILAKSHPDISIINWGFFDLRDKLFSLHDQDIELILGHVPSKKNFTNLKFEAIEPVIASIAYKENPPESELVPVPKDKLYINGFSPAIETVITIGMLRTPLVKKYFNYCSDSGLGDKIAGTLNEKYKEFKEHNLNSVEIYNELLNFIMGSHSFSDTDHLAAAYTVLSYYFENCTIFEKTKSEIASS